jgi:hypothetical protein
MFRTSVFSPSPIWIANKISFTTSVLPLTIQTVHYSPSHTLGSGEAERPAEESCLLKPTSPSFEVNILRKALSYSPRYPCMSDVMDIDTGSVHE